MLTVPAVKIQQFKQEFFVLNLSAPEVQRLVRFEVLGDPGMQGGAAKARTRGRASPVNWAKREGR
jgi:hypothetical protein